ncbi:right-handed parallel beta-helix repeat-containing protein [Flavobacteriales bacterium]|nr:right-handed parallel beta-helix repeat-containing protein [Flavobacteriales bacterium]
MSTEFARDQVEHLTTTGITHTENSVAYDLSVYLLGKFGIYAGGTQASLITALASGVKRITLGSSGNYALNSTITIPANTELTSTGATITVSGNTTIFNLSQGSKVNNINFTGSGISSGNTAEIPVRISGVGACEVRGNTFTQIGGVAVVVRQYYSDHDGSRIVDNDITYCNSGIYLEERGEYCTVGQNTVNNNTTGITAQGGNNRVVNNTITDNVTGLHIEAGTNDAHGNIDSNSINHNTTNILIDAINVEEMSFNGNSIYVGKITLNGCSGVTFNGGLIESSSLIEEKGATECEFRNVKFPGGISNTPNDGTASKVLYKDCIQDRSTLSSSATSINGAYSEVKRNGATTLSTLSDTVSIFNSELFNAITANTAFTVEQLYDTSTFKWEPTSAIVERNFATQVNMQLSISRTGADVAIDDVHCLIVDATNNNIVYGVASASPQNILTGDVRTHTFAFAGEVPREDFQVKLINNTANTITILGDQTDARSKVVVTGW